MQSAKHKLNQIVFQYKTFFKDEYKDFLIGIKDKKNSNELATNKQDGVIERAMWDMPETLYGLIIKKLTTEELEWFNQKGKSGGQQYIVKTFKEFKVPEKL